MGSSGAADGGLDQESEEGFGALTSGVGASEITQWQLSRPPEKIAHVLVLHSAGQMERQLLEKSVAILGLEEEAAKLRTMMAMTLSAQ